MPSLNAENNELYGGSLINQKYAPLEGITVPVGDKDFYVKLFNNRIKTLSDQNVFPKKLTLITSGLPAPISVDTPPMVVISSNRAEWMKTLFDDVETKNSKAAITGYNDAESFESGPLPWYSPRRSKRPLFIVVHRAEYGYYKKLLAGYLNVYVVGWKFPATAGGLEPAGFGASRFAALEFVKFLNYKRAWTVDDNVVNINGFPNTPQTIEDLMTAGLPDGSSIAGIGFTAATKNEDMAGVYKESTFVAKDLDFPRMAPGLLQQVVLWNLDFLKTKKLTFSPYFVTSNEDVSLSNYLQVFKYAQRIITGLKIVKMAPTNDKKNQGVQELDGIKTRLSKLLYNLEKTTQISAGGARAVDLSSFVETTILPNSQDKGSELNTRKRKALERKTQSMAIEQVLAETLFANKWAPAKLFDPYSDFGETAVERRDG